MAIITAVPASTNAFAIHGFKANLVLCYYWSASVH
jgi:hypothetical protein